MCGDRIEGDSLEDAASIYLWHVSAMILALHGLEAASRVGSSDLGVREVLVADLHLEEQVLQNARRQTCCCCSR